MANAVYPLDAYVIIDNNALISICEFCCFYFNSQKNDDLIPLACNEIEAFFTAINKFSIGQKVYTTDIVWNEFIPEKSDYAKHAKSASNRTAIPEQIAQ